MNEPAQDVEAQLSSAREKIAQLEVALDRERDKVRALGAPPASGVSIRPSDEDRVFWTRRLFGKSNLLRLGMAAAFIWLVYRLWSTGCWFSAACLAAS